MEKPILLLINLHSRRGLMQFGEVVASFNELGVQYVIGQVMSPGDFAKCIHRYHEGTSKYGHFGQFLRTIKHVADWRQP